jgi:hypothetical protein
VALGASAGPLQPREYKPKIVELQGQAFQPGPVAGIDRNGGAEFFPKVFEAATVLLCMGIKEGYPSTKAEDFVWTKEDNISFFPDGVDLGVAWESAGSKNDGGWPKVDGGWKATVKPNTMYNGTTTHDYWTFFMSDKDLNTDNCISGLSGLRGMLQISSDRGDKDAGLGMSFDRLLGPDSVGRYELFSPKSQP